MSREAEEKQLIKTLKEEWTDNFYTELHGYCQKIAEEKILQKSSFRQELSRLLIQHLLTTLDSLYVQPTIAILRYMSRDKDIVLNHMSNPLFTKLICTLGGLDVDESKEKLVKNINEECEVNSCKCLCNIFFLSKDSNTVKLYNDSKFVRTVVKLIANHKTRSFQQNSITLRLLFLVAALSQEGKKKLDEYEARKTVLQCLKDTLPPASASESVRSYGLLSDDAANICSEILKVMFYLNMDLRRKPMHDQQELEELDLLLELCAVILLCKSDNAKLQEELHCHAGNAIYSVPPACFHVQKLIGEEGSTSDGVDLRPVISLLNILRTRISNDFIACDVLHPMLALFSQLCRLSRDIRIYLKQEILPPRKDFKRRPEEGKELRNKLIKLFTHNNTDLKHAAADFLFVLCKEKVDRFVKYTGYGNAAGLLALRGLLAGGQGETVYSDTDSDSDTEEYKQVSDEVNPVTGHVPPPRPNPMEGMSEEQKEYLAMQLANEFSKLSSDSPLQPMCVGDDGKLVSFQQKVHETELRDVGSSDDDV